MSPNVASLVGGYSMSCKEVDQRLFFAFLACYSSKLSGRLVVSRKLHILGNFCLGI